MAKFFYKAKKGPTEIIEKIIEAKSKEQVVDALIKKGYVPVQVKEYQPAIKKVKKGKSFSLFKKVKPREITVFTSQLASLVKSKVSILEVITILQRQNNNDYFKNVLAQMRKKIKDGSTLSAAMSDYPDIFSPLYINITRAGEMGGVLEDSLARLAEFREKKYELLAKIKSALIYPIFIVGVGIISIIVLFIFVVPRLVSLFGQMEQQLPLPTTILIGISNLLKNYWYLFLLAIGFLIWGFRRVVEEQKDKLDEFKLKLPLLGNFIKKRELAIFAKTFQVLLDNGIAVFRAIEMAASTLGNQTLKDEFKKVQQDVIDGKQIGESLKESSIFPAFMCDIISVGEKSNNLSTALAEINEFYQQDVDKTLKAITSLLEPIIILVMGLIIGFIVFAMLLPVFELNMGM
jgi:type II secretory pathway component PulF